MNATHPTNLRILTLFALAVAASGLLLMGPSSRVTAADEDAIKDVIEESYTIYFEACKVDGHDEIEENKNALVPYWSPATRTTVELATRSAHQVAVYSTPLPGPMETDLASLRQTATAAPTMVPAEQIEMLASYLPPTPNWWADDTPLEERWQEIDNCQAEYDVIDHVGMMLDGEIIEFSYDSIDISGDMATVKVRINRWYEIIVRNGVDNTVTSEVESTQIYTLQKVSGNWIITDLKIKPLL